MIDSAQELVDKLIKYFPKTDDVSGELTDGIKAFVRRHNFNGMELERLYMIIQENCGNFPIVKVVAKLWKEQGERYEHGNGTGAGYSAISKYKHTGWREVVNEMQSIRSAQEHRELKNSEIDILNDYEDLLYVYNLLCTVSPLVMPEDSKDTYLRKVKEDVDNNVPIKFDRVRASIERRHQEYNQKYGEQITERDYRITKSVTDMNAAFGARSKEIELSDYEKEQCRLGFR